MKKSGVLIITHPLREEFHKQHHPSYIDFYENVLSKTLSADKIEREYESEFATNKRYIGLYRNSNAYHGVHPFYMWYWGAYGLSYVGKTIVVGAKSPHVLERFNFTYAEDINSAVKKARKFLKNESPSITYLKVPPIVMVNVKNS